MPLIYFSNNYAPLKSKQFRRFITAKFCSSMSGRLLFTVISWEIYRITGDPLSIGLLGLFEVIPAVVSALFAGNIIDSYNRKRIVQIAAIFYFIIASVLLVFSAHAEEHLIIYAFYGYAFGIGLYRSFWSATLSTILPNLIGIKAIPKAAPWSTGSFLIASVVGHSVGGFLIAYSTLHFSVILSLALILIAGYNVSRLPSQPVSQSKQKNTWLSIQEGISYVWNTQIILSALSLDLFAVLFGGVVALLPIYAKDILFISPAAFGWLNASMDIGAGLGILMMGIWPLKRRQGRKMIFSVGLFGLFIIIFGLSTNFWLSFFALMLCGMFDSVSMIVRGVILQSRVPDNVRGRVMSVNSIFVASSNELGQFESGVASRLIGTVPAVVFGGCITIFASALVYFKSKKLRNEQWKN